MQIAIPLYDGFTALDAIGPYEPLVRLPGAELVFCGAEARTYRTDKGTPAIQADATFAEITAPEVIVVPGGPGSRAEASQHLAVAEWVAAVHPTTTWTTSVCTGSLILAAAGVLDGMVATTHWACVEDLESFGVTYTAQRVVEQGKVMTAAGVSSGIDMGLTLAARIMGDDVAKAIQLGIEYDPQPPFDAGSPEKAGPAIVDLVRAVVASSAKTG